MKFGLSRANVLSLYLPAMIFAASNGVVVPALPTLSKSLSVSFGMAMSTLAAQLLGLALSTIPTGYLLDRLGSRSVTITGLLLVAASALLTTTVTAFNQLLVYQFMTGWGAQMWMLGRLTLIGTQAAPGSRGRQVTGMTGIESIGMLLGPLLGGVLVVRFGAAQTYGFKAAFCMTAALVVFAGARGTQAKHEGKPARAEAEPDRKLMEMLKTPPLPQLAAIQIMGSLSRGSVFSGTFDFYMTYAYGVSPVVIGLLRSTTGTLGVPITFLAGHVMDRFGRKATIVPGFGLMSVGMLAMVVVSTLKLPFEFFAASLIGVHLAISITSGSMQTLGIDSAPPEWRGRFLAFLRLGSEFGNFLSPVGFALCATSLGYPAAFAFLMVMSASVSMTVARTIKENFGARKQPGT
jgi:MFS family permease